MDESPSPGTSQAPPSATVRMLWLTLPAAALWSLPIGMWISDRYAFPWNAVLVSARTSDVFHLGLIGLVIVAMINSWRALHIQCMAGLSSTRCIILGVFNLLSAVLSPFFLIAVIGSTLD